MSINTTLLFAALEFSNRVWWVVPLITIPALILGIVPFLRLNKKRRISSKHLIPFIIHLSVIVILSLVIAGIARTVTRSEAKGNVVMFVVDMSDSNAPTKDEMEEYMNNIMKLAYEADEHEGKYKEGSKTDPTQFGLIVFGGTDENGIIKNKSGQDVVLPGGIKYVDPSKVEHQEGDDILNFLDDYVLQDDQAPRKESNLTLAIDKAMNDLLAKGRYEEKTKRVILLSDGRQTSGDAYSAASTLKKSGIALDCAYFDFVNSGSDRVYKEIQVINLGTNGTVKLGEEVEAQVVINSTYHITNATITLKDVSGATLVSQSGVVIPKGQSAHILRFTPRRYTVNDEDYANNNELKGQVAVSETGVQAISVEVTTSKDNDQLLLNNSYHSWYTFETQGEILIVYGDSDQLDQLKNSGILLMDQTASGKETSSGIIKNAGGTVYSVDTIATQYFPHTLEKMLKYDEIILMNTNFSKLGQANINEETHEPLVPVTQIADNIKRYVEEVGRGLLFTAGSNIYNYSDSYRCPECEETFKLDELIDKIKCPTPECPGLPSNEGSFVESPLNKILPVDLKVDEEKETVAMVIVVDLSSSMKELVKNSGVVCKTCNTSYVSKPSDSFCSVCNEKTSYSDPTRYHVVLDSVKKVITESKFAPEDYIGVVVFDQDYHVALEIQPIGDEENRKTICEQMEYEFEHYYYAHYIDKATGEESDIRVNLAKDGQIGSNKYVDKIDGKEPLYVLPSNYKDGGEDKATGDCIKSRGTSYKWPVQEASAMLARASNITSIEIKQVVFMSDGAPNDKGSGYEGIVERMAKGGAVTSTIAIGISAGEAGAIAELEKISNAGRGDIFLVNSAKDLEEDLTEITDSIQGKLLNEYITVQPMRDSLNSIVHEGVQEYDIIHGYYGTTIKEEAERVIYVDNLRPLYAEWEFGLGKVCALMTDLGNVEWTGTMFNDNDEIANVRLIQNIVLSPIQKSIDSTGLKYSATRDDNKISLLVETYHDLALRNQKVNVGGENVELEEVVRATVYRFDTEKKIWVAYGTYYGAPYSSAKYKVTIQTNSIDETYVVVLDLYKAAIGYTSTGTKVYPEIDFATYGDDPLRDTTALAVVGKTLEEYDVLRSTDSLGKDLLSGIVGPDRTGLLVESNPNLTGRAHGMDLAYGIDSVISYCKNTNWRTEDIFYNEKTKDLENIRSTFNKLVEELEDLRKDAAKAAKEGNEEAEQKAYDDVVAAIDEVRKKLNIKETAYEGIVSMMDETGVISTFRTNTREIKKVTETIPFDIPLIAIALVLFVLDIVFRNFVIKRKPKKVKELSEEEVLESMRGR